jgi:peroxiredoxin (alkyl hydroperoxide reductase subunit C)
MSELTDGCVKPAGGPVLPVGEPAVPGVTGSNSQEVKKVLARVGKEAIDFEASAFIAGEGFKPVKLSDYKGKWIILCFYPGDFTFV